jgi:uncharacterized protein (DUF1800 family)
MASTREGAGLEPKDALAPFRPEVDGPWDRAAASHLARRAAFGAPSAVVKGILEAGPQRAAGELMAARPPSEDELLAQGAAIRGGSRAAVQSAWVYRMLRGADPAGEKLALFWHGHFATSDRKVESPLLMARQIELFREQGRGPFEDLLLGVARDPAMLLWLDSNSSRRGQPNENFARELMELFSLGIGNYTERDIKEAARAFTGWHVRDYEYHFIERAHDRGRKEVFGAAGELGGEDIVRLCAEKDACAELIAAKLFAHYVGPDPDPALRRELGGAYRACGRRAGEFLALILSSRAFYAPSARRVLVSPPADFAVGALRTLEAAASTDAVASALRDMGQELLAPPSVKGWDGGTAWLRSTTLLARYRFAEEVASGGLEARVPWASLEGLAGGQEAVVARLHPEGLPREVLEKLLQGAGGDTRALVASCLELPEYQFF